MNMSEYFIGISIIAAIPVLAFAGMAAMEILAARKERKKP